jgi:hypothetical protein
MPTIHDGQTYSTLDEVSLRLDKVILMQSEILRVNLRKKKKNSEKNDFVNAI